MIKTLSSLLLALWVFSASAFAQGTASVSQSWLPQGRASLSVSSVSGNVAFPNAGLIANICNTGANDAYLNFGISNSVVSTTAAGFLLKAGFCLPYSRQNFGTNSTYLAAITASSTTTLAIETGTGTPLPSPYAGGGTTVVSGTVAANQGTAGASPWPVKIDQTTPGTTNGVQVNAALPAGQNGVGNVGGKTVAVCVTPTVTTANSYGTNYVVGGKLTFANAFTSTGSGILQGVVVTMGKVETNGFTFFPFNSDPSASTWTDAAVANINATDIPKQRSPVSLSFNSQLGTTTINSAAGIGEALASGTTSLFGVLIANAALTNQFTSASSVQVCVKILQDL